MPKEWSGKDERMYAHVKEGYNGDSKRAKRIAAATVNKQRSKEGRTKKCMKPSVTKAIPSRDSAKPTSESHSPEVIKPGSPSPKKMMASVSPSNNVKKGDSMSDIKDLFKSELGGGETAITKCIHCKHDLTKSDLQKGIGTNFVADDNDQPHDGGSGQVDSSRGVPGAKENDDIAPLLKGLKGEEAGDGEQFLVSKSEMSDMGMDVSDIDGKDSDRFIITKGEVARVGAQSFVPFLRRLKKSMRSGVEVPKPNVVKKGPDLAPHYTPRAGGVQDPNGFPLVSWSEGTDKEVASYIEKHGGFGQGSDESIRTQGRGND